MYVYFSVTINIILNNHVPLIIIEEFFYLLYFYNFQNNLSIIISCSLRSWIYSDYLILNII